MTRDYLGEHPLIFCDLAFEGEKPAGIATWFWTYGSFATARKIFLSDLFVRPEFRGRHYGKALLANLAKRVLAHGGVGVDWDVLDWNKPSIDFYDGIGATPNTGLDRLRHRRRCADAIGKIVSIISLVIAIADNGVIGKDGRLPWRIPEDMRRFKALTIGKPCIMGRKTWDSLPRKPLARTAEHRGDA